MKKHIIPQNLQYLLKKKGISCNKLFIDLPPSSGVTSYKQLDGFKAGRNEPNIDVVRGLSQYFNLTMEDFCYTDLHKRDLIELLANATPRKFEFITNFKGKKLRNPVLYEGWISRTTLSLKHVKRKNERGKQFNLNKNGNNKFNNGY